MIHVPQMKMPAIASAPLSELALKQQCGHGQAALYRGESQVFKEISRESQFDSSSPNSKSGTFAAIRGIISRRSTLRRQRPSQATSQELAVRRGDQVPRDAAC